MRIWRDDDTLMTRYLLGEMSEGRRVRLEERLLADEDSYQQLLVAEDDLFDAYARDQLGAERRLKLEERFLASSEWAARVESARDLRALAELALSADGLTTEPRPFFKWPVFAAALEPRSRGVLAAVAATAVLIFALLLWQSWVPGEVGSEGAAWATTASVALIPALRSEGDGLPRLELTAATQKVELEAWVEDKGRYRSFRARLETSRGETLWGPAEILDVGSPGGDSTVALRLPVGVLRLPGDGSLGVRHVLRLEGAGPTDQFERINEFEFEVVKAPAGV